MARPVFIEPVFNKDQGDCTLNCLVMWTGKSYQEVVAAAPKGAHKEGMWNHQVITTAAKLGTTLVSKRRFDLYGDFGILMLNPEPAKGRPSHAVVLLDGQVLDPYNGRLWLDVEVYLKTERYKTGVLLAELEE